MLPGRCGPATRVRAKPSVRPRSGRSIRSSTRRPCIPARCAAHPRRAERRGAARRARGPRAGATCGIRAAGVPAARAEREDVQPGQPAVLDEASEFSNIASVSVGKPAMMSAPNTMSGPRRPHRLAEGDGVVAEVAALHPLQDHVVAGLQRQVQVRHQPRLAGDRLDEPRVGLDRVDRGEPQPRQVRARRRGSPATRSPSRGVALEVGAPARQVDAGQHHLVEAAVDQPADLLDHRGDRHAARVAAAVGDDAEGAAVVAAVLHLHVGARPGAEAVDQRRRGPRARP